MVQSLFLIVKQWIDVDSVGHLVVKNESGERITLSSGEIRI